MKDCKFRNYLTSNIDIDIHQVEECLSFQEIKNIKKGTFLLREGEICQHAYFVEHGLLRTFSIDDKGKEHLLQFAPEGWFIADHDSLYFKKPSLYFIQALEDSTIYQLNDNFFDHMASKNHAFSQFNTKLLHNHISQLQKRIIQLISATAEDRYLTFTHLYPDIPLRVPQTMVASYLGITPESLSRIRKELAQKNFYQKKNNL